MNKQLDYSKYFSSPELLANAVLEQYKNEIGNIEYPINPFKILKSLDVKLVIKNFKDLEGLYIPALSEDDIDVVAINFNGQVVSGVALVGGALYVDPKAEEGIVPLSPPTIVTGKDSGVTLEGELQFGFYVYDNVSFYDIKPISAPAREEGGYTITIKSTPGTVVHRSKGEYRYTGPNG